MTNLERHGNRIGAWILIGSAIVVVLGLGALWRHDRARHWERPHWQPAEFVALRGPLALDGVRELWVMPVNPRCPHCRAHVARAAAARRQGSDVRLGILLVDTPKPPAAATFANVAVDGLWWDARETWRRRWGHRVYGERVVFDGAGRYVRTIPPSAGP